MLGDILFGVMEVSVDIRKTVERRVGAAARSTAVATAILNII